MRLKLLKLVTILLLAGSSDGRPQQLEVSASPQPEVENDNTEGWRAVQPKIAQEPITVGKDLPQIVEGNSRVRVSNTERDARNLPDMKLSLRTVATQLLNVTNPNESSKTVADLKNDSGLKSESKKLLTVAKIEKIDKSGDPEEKSKIEDKNLLIKEINSEISSLESIGVSFGRPMNSKFGYFESSHPGQAMAITDEELEKELTSKRDMVAYKNNPTTSGGISTWILLNPPTTTPKTTQKESKKPETVNKFVTKPTASIEKVEIDQKVNQKPTATVEKMTPAPSSGKVSTSHMKPVVSGVRNTPKTTTVKPQTAQTFPKRVITKLEQPDADATTPKIGGMTPVAIVEKNVFTTTEKTATTTKKIVPAQRIPPQKFSSLGTTTLRPTTKTTKPNFNRGKFPGRTTTTVSPVNQAEKIATTVKVEKVTFRPVQMIPTPKDEVRTEKPVLLAKIKTPVPTAEVPKTTSAPPARSTTSRIRETTTVFKTDFTGSDLLEFPPQGKPSMTKVNNVLKVQLKKPVDEASKIGVESIKVNEPVLKIEEATDEKMGEFSDQGVSQALNNSEIDLKFDFNPELTKIQIEDSTEQPSVATTTKKPRRSTHKRRKNKNKTRRRKPSTATTESNEISMDPVADETALQESKVEPETKEVNATKIKKKQVEKPIGTQIYNYLSREIMPSFGVVSLVGLGLGIASYFLYPFGGGIARRNYEVEPNYKYNLGEYGGNYGQSEEEVFSKVLQGMTNHENKYGGLKDYDQNTYYRYQQFGGPAITDTKLTKKSDRRYPPASSGPMYKPLENTYELNYKNTEFKYPEVSTTPNYFERQKQSGYTVSNEGDDGDRQFVVGNVPKEYSYDDVPVVGQKSPTYDDNGGGQTTQFEQNVAQNYGFSKNSANIPQLQSYGQPEALPLKNDGNYAEIEITPAAVAVEHGPRSLKVKRSVDEQLLRSHPRFRRDSVIQVIPPSGSQETTEKEEDLSNEILDILDFMIPGKDTARKVHEDKTSNAIEGEEKTEKKREEDKTKNHESTTKKVADVEDTTTSAKLSVTTEGSSAASSSSTIEAQNVEVTSTPGTSVSEEATTVEQPKEVSTEEIVTEAEVKDLEETTLEWLDPPTTVKTEKEEGSGFNIFNFVKTVAEVKFRLGLTILKHASEGFARYLGGIQKRINGEE